MPSMGYLEWGITDAPVRTEFVSVKDGDRAALAGETALVEGYGFYRLHTDDRISRALSP
jgi:hypothetical protein